MEKLKVSEFHINFNSIKHTHLLVFTLVLVSCGVNKVPENSDIKKAMQEQFGGCKYIKLSDSNKLNGRDLGNGKYKVQQEFKLEFIPPNDYHKTIEEISYAYKTYSDLTTETNKKFWALEGERKERIMASDGKYSSGEIDYESRKQENSNIDSDFKAKVEALEKQKFEELKKRGVSTNGEPPGVSSLIPKMRQDFDTACKNISRLGERMVSELIGYTVSDQIEAFDKGVEKKMTQEAVYVKTENGWMLQ